ncbi:unnamed protein product, partial [Brassica rapa subsp. narinosa]
TKQTPQVHQQLNLLPRNLKAEPLTLNPLHSPKLPPRRNFIKDSHKNALKRRPSCRAELISKGFRPRARLRQTQLTTKRDREHPNQQNEVKRTEKERETTIAIHEFCFTRSDGRSITPHQSRYNLHRAPEKATD